MKTIKILVLVIVSLILNPTSSFAQNDSSSELFKSSSDMFIDDFCGSKFRKFLEDKQIIFNIYGVEEYTCFHHLSIEYKFYFVCYQVPSNSKIFEYGFIFTKNGEVLDGKKLELELEKFQELLNCNSIIQFKKIDINKNKIIAYKIE